MSESMVERVARALALADLDPETRAVVNLDAHMLHVREHYSELARAAIEAMREPTEAQHDAARDWSAKKYGKPIGFDASDGCWRAMIDAALKP